MSPFRAGVIALVLISIGIFLGFTKDIPFTSPYRVNAVFESANSIRPGSPVRIAGVEVGKVTEITPLPSGTGCQSAPSHQYLPSSERWAPSGTVIAVPPAQATPFSGRYQGECRLTGQEGQSCGPGLTGTEDCPEGQRTRRHEGSPVAASPHFAQLTHWPAGHSPLSAL